MGPLSEQERRVLHEAAERTMGQPAADALLRGLPPVEWREFATKTDLAVLRTDLTLDFTTGMKALEDKLVDKFDKKIEALDAKIDSKTGKLNRKINRKFKELDQKIDARFSALDAKIDNLGKAIQAQGRWQTGLTVTLIGMILTAASVLQVGRTAPAPAPAPAPATVSPARPTTGGDLSTAPPSRGSRGMGAR